MMRIIRRVGVTVASWIFRHCVKPVPKSSKLDEPTRFVDLLFCRSGGCVYTCLCGCRYFGGDYDFEEGELEKLRADPEATEIQDGPTVWHMPQGCYVDECPCGRLQAYERFIWDYRERIAEYLKERSADQLGQHHALVADLDQVADVPASGGH